MSAIDMILLYDYYGDLLTDRQKECFELRYNQDLSLGEIGELQGVSRQAVSKWETGQSYPDVELLPRIADFFEISLAIGPVVMIAIVLFAVQTLAKETSAAMLNSAPLFPLILFVIRPII